MLWATLQLIEAILLIHLHSQKVLSVSRGCQIESREGLCADIDVNRLLSEGKGHKQFLKQLACYPKAAGVGDI